MNIFLIIDENILLLELRLYDKKKNKRISNDLIEMDLNDLESYAHYKHGEEFLKLPDTVVGNKTIIEWFVVDDISYWWFIAPMIHPKFKSATMFIDRLDSVIKQHSISTISLQGCFDKINLIQNICNSNKIKLKISSKYYCSAINKLSKNFVKEVAYKKITQKKFQKRIKCFNKKNMHHKPKTNSTIITAPGIYRRNSYDLESQSVKKEEFFIKPFLDFLSKNNLPILCFDLDYTFRGTTDALKERLSSKFNWWPIEILLQDPPEKITKNTINELKKQFNNFKKNNLDSIFIYRNISLWKFLEPTFLEIFYEPNLPTYVHLIHKLEKFFKEIKPKQIIQVYETGPLAKAFEVAAEKLKIKTFGIQHGLIPYDHADYIFKEIKNKKFPYGNILPGITFVFGNYYKKILTEKGSYPKEQVVALGHPSYFNIEKIKKSLVKTNLLKKYNLPTKKIILIPLSSRFVYFKNSPDRVLLDSLYDKFQNDNDVLILVRPHPGDKFDQKMLSKIYPSVNFKITNATLVEDLTVSDIVIVLPMSTVSTEAVLFEKPLIIVDISTKNIDSNFDKVYHELINSKVA